jgi:ATP-binding cassette subfamily B protein
MTTDKPSMKSPTDGNPVVGRAPSGDSGLAQSKPNLRILWGYGWKFLRLFPRYTLLLVVLSVISSVVMVSTPLLLGKITNSIEMMGRAAATQTGTETPPGKASAPGLQKQSTDGKGGLDQTAAPSPIGKRNLLWAYVLWLACAVGGIILALGVRYAQTALDVNMANAIRGKLFSHIIRERLEFFHANDVGRLTMLINQMSIEAQITFRQTVLDPFFQAVSFCFAISALAFSFSQLQQQGGYLIWIGVAVVLLLALLSPLLVGRMGNRLQSSSANVLKQNMAVAGLVNGSLKSPEEVQAFDAEDFFASKYQDGLDKIRTSRIRQTLTVEFINTLNSLPTVLIQILFIGVALMMVLLQPAAAAQAGYVVSILLLVPLLMMPIQAISNYMVMLRSSWPSVETVLRHLTDLEPCATPVFPSATEKPEPTLEAKNLIFKYRPDLQPVFNDVSFTVPAGKITGLVAKMGQGKTTFFRLTLGFYQPQQGDVMLGGRPIRNYSLAELRRHVVMMAQFPAFFHDTLRDNLRIAKPEATDAEIESLCRQTGIWPILTDRIGSESEKASFPNPLDRQFDGAQMFSGGQKKLLALTRCLLRSPTFLLLDEPTAGMDNEEKYGLVEDLRKACADKTVMVVDHDILWLLKFCDHFIVLDQGRVVQQGDGRDLLRQPGLFKELHDRTVSLN